MIGERRRSRVARVNREHDGAALFGALQTDGILFGRPFRFCIGFGFGLGGPVGLLQYHADVCFLYSGLPTGSILRWLHPGRSLVSHLLPR
mgnify:CR=1 FL=1